MEKNKTVYTKAQIIKMVARSARIRKSLVKRVYEELENEIVNLLSTATKDNDVSLRLFEGISIDGELLPAKEKVNNLTGQTIITLEKIKAKANITRYYCEKLLRRKDSEE